MNIDKILIIGNGGIAGKSVAGHLEQLKKDFGDNILVIESNEIIYPANVTEDDIINIQTDQFSHKQLMEMVRDFSTRNEIDRFVEHIRKTPIELPSIELCMDEPSKSDFIPVKGGGKHGRGNKRLIRK